MVTNTTRSDMERMDKAVSDALEALSDSKLQRLLSILESEGYVERLVQKLQQKLSKMSKLNGQLGSLERQRSALASTMENVRPTFFFVSVAFVCLSVTSTCFWFWVFFNAFAKRRSSSCNTLRITQKAWKWRWRHLSPPCMQVVLLDPFAHLSISWSSHVFHVVMQVVRCQLLERSINCSARILHISLELTPYLANTVVVMNDWSRFNFMPMNSFRSILIKNKKGILPQTYWAESLELSSNSNRSTTAVLLHQHNKQVKCFVFLA